MKQNKVPLTVIILTFNEEINLPSSLDSVIQWADQVIVVDSFSTDHTLEIAKKYGVLIYQNPWTDWATQRNWALDNLPIKNEWVLFLDADEQISPELAEEIKETLKNVSDEVAGYYINRRFIFLGRELKHGGYNFNWVLRLVRPKRTRVLPVGDSEYFEVDGKIVKLKSVMFHEDKKDISFYIEKHNKISLLAVKQYLNKDKILKENKKRKSAIEGKFRVWIKENILAKLPLFWRPLFLFTYKYFLKFGFLDGKEGFIYYFLHYFWYPYIVDAKILEQKKKLRSE